MHLMIQLSMRQLIRLATPGSVAAFLLALVGAVAMIRDGGRPAPSVPRETKMRKMPVGKGTPLFVADDAATIDHRLVLTNALQLTSNDADALAGTAPPRFYGRSVVLCGDPLLAEQLKVLHAGSITMSDPSLGAFLPAAELANMAHPITIECDGIYIVEIDNRGLIAMPHTQRIDSVLFTFVHQRNLDTPRPAPSNATK